MSESVAAPAAAVVPPPPPPAAAPAAPAVVATPSPAAVAPAAVPAAAPAAVAVPEVKPPAPDEKKPDASAKPAAAAAPVEIEIKLPEGAKYEAEALGDFKALAKEHGISAKAAEAIFALDQKHLKVNAEKAQKAFEDQAKAARAKDVEALKADKEFGGGNYDKTVAAAKSAVRQFGGEELSKLLEQSGLDNHPAVVKFAAKVRAAIKEDDTGSRAPGSQPDPTTTQQPMSRSQRSKAHYLQQMKDGKIR